MSRRRYRHWCETCHGHVGPGSPCAEDEGDPDAERDAQQDALAEAAADRVTESEADHAWGAA